MFRCVSSFFSWVAFLSKRLTRLVLGFAQCCFTVTYNNAFSTAIQRERMQHVQMSDVRELGRAVEDF